VLFFSFEESPNQIIRNMHSIGLRLEPLVKAGLVRFHSARPSLYGLEMHLATMFKEIAAFKPAVVIMDPITSLMDAGTASEGKGMVTRLIDYLKGGQVTSLFTSLTQGSHVLQQSEAANRVLYVLKARGMAHSNQIREFLISNRGIDLVDAYIGPSGVLTGSARAAQTAREKAEALATRQEAARRKRELERKRTALERQINGLRSEHEAGAEELRQIDEQVGTQTRLLTTERTELGRLRQADVAVPASARSKPRQGRRS
jgi:circadian clock protein KaiC